MSLAHLPGTDVRSSRLTADSTTRWQILLYLPEDAEPKGAENQPRKLNSGQINPVNSAQMLQVFGVRLIQDSPC